MTSKIHSYHNRMLHSACVLTFYYVEVMFAVKLYDFCKFPYLTILLILVITGCYALHRHEIVEEEESSIYGSCTINIWSTRDMKADDLPSIIALTKARPHHKPHYFLPQFKATEQFLQIEFKHKEKLLIVCSRENINFVETTLECSNGVKVPDIEIIEECKASPPKPSLRNKKKSCGDNKNNKLYEIGYRIHLKYTTEQFVYGDAKSMMNKFYPFIEVCMDPTRKTTSYTSHKINGKVIAARQITTSIPDEFKMEGYIVIDERFTTDEGEKRHLKKIYRPQKQFHYLYKLFGDKLRDYFDNEENNFVPRQLTPDYDMLLKNYKTLTHYYINTAPQWRILACTWDALEELIRERVSKRNYEVTVYTGTYELLTLDGIEVFISPEGLPVPKYFWKVVVHKRERDYAAIGFITSNNPYDNEKEPFCKSVCRTYGWPIDVKTPGLGKTVCCTVKEMLRKMGIKIPIMKVITKSNRMIDVSDNGMIDVSDIKEVLSIRG